MSNYLMHNGRIWRQCGNLYSWLLFDSDSGLITDCGVSDPPYEKASQSCDLQQCWVFPGFHDSHSHIGETGKFFNEKYDLKLPKSINEFKKGLATIAAKQAGNGQCIVGYNWDDHMMDRIPNVEDLDAIVSDVPVVLLRVCMHICVVNSAALSKLGLFKSADTLANSYIGKFGKENPEKAGEPNGLLFEEEGKKKLFELLPAISSEQKKENILLALRQCLSQGITSVHACEDAYWNEYVSLAKSSQLPIHCYYSPYCSNIGSSNFPSKPGEAYDNLSCDMVKVFMDGALGPETAALSVPYLKKSADGSDNYGLLQKTEEEFAKVFKWINDAGFRFEIHVIGDKAAEVALDHLEAANVAPSSRPIFVHCQILRDDLIERMVKCGVVPTIQPSSASTDSSWVEKSLPPPLKKCIHLGKTLLNRGIICGGSSDSPVETTDPLQGIYDAIYRPSPDGTPFIESECLSFTEAIRLYTSGSAYADFAEKSKGKLEVGFQADIVVLDVPLQPDGKPADLAENPKLLKQTTVKEVWVKGKKTWAKKS